jgi:hypothetical protein
VLHFFIRLLREYGEQIGVIYWYIGATGGSLRGEKLIPNVDIFMYGRKLQSLALACINERRDYQCCERVDYHNLYVQISGLYNK